MTYRSRKAEIAGQIREPRLSRVTSPLRLGIQASRTVRWLRKRNCRRRWSGAVSIGRRWHRGQPETRYAPRSRRVSAAGPHRTGRNDLNRPKFLAPSITRLPARISSRTLRNSTRSQCRRSMTPSRRSSGGARPVPFLVLTARKDPPEFLGDKAGEAPADDPVRPLQIDVHRNGEARPWRVTTAVHPLSPWQ